MNVANKMFFNFFSDVETYFMPWLLERVEGELSQSMISRTVLDGKHCECSLLCGSKKYRSPTHGRSLKIGRGVFLIYYRGFS